MKKFFTLMLFMGMLSVEAHNPVFETGLWQQATEISRQLANELQLNEQEYIQVKKLTYNKLCTAALISQNYAYAPALRKQKLQEIENRYQWQVRHALNARQVEELLASELL